MRRRFLSIRLESIKIASVQSSNSVEQTEIFPNLGKSNFSLELIKQIVNLGFSRVLDAVGRIGVPKKIREEFRITPDTSYDWYIIKTEQGNFLGFPVGESRQEEEEKALYEKLKKKFETS